MLRDGRKAFTPLKSVTLKLQGISARRANTFRLIGPSDGTYAVQGDFYGDGKTTTLTLVRSDQAPVNTVVQTRLGWILCTVEDYPTNIGDSMPVSGGQRAYPVPLDATHLSIYVAASGETRVFYARQGMFKKHAFTHLMLEPLKSRS